MQGKCLNNPCSRRRGQRPSVGVDRGAARVHLREDDIGVVRFNLHALRRAGVDEPIVGTVCVAAVLHANRPRGIAASLIERFPTNGTARLGRPALISTSKPGLATSVSVQSRTVFWSRSGQVCVGPTCPCSCPASPLAPEDELLRRDHDIGSAAATAVARRSARFLDARSAPASFSAAALPPRSSIGSGLGMTRPCYSKADCRAHTPWRLRRTARDTSVSDGTSAGRVITGRHAG